MHLLFFISQVESSFPNLVQRHSLDLFCFFLKRQISKGRRHHGSFLLPTRYSLFLNPPLLPKILHKHCLQFLLGRLSYQREIKNKGYSKLRWMANKVYYGRCVNGKWSHNANNRLSTNRVLIFRGFLLRSTRIHTWYHLATQGPSQFRYKSENSSLCDCSPWFLTVGLVYGKD